jgi:D-alanine-D-alanine ligase
VMRIPADLPSDTAEQVREMAIRAFKAIDCTGLARVDFFIRKDNGEALINEINTMPGFTPYSMYAKLWEHSGISYSELVDRLIQLAIQRYEEKASLKTTFEVE